MNLTRSTALRIWTDFENEEEMAIDVVLPDVARAYFADALAEIIAAEPDPPGGAFVLEYARLLPEPDRVLNQLAGDVAWAIVRDRESIQAIEATVSIPEAGFGATLRVSPDIDDEAILHLRFALEVLPPGLVSLQQGEIELTDLDPSPRTAVTLLDRGNLVESAMDDIRSAAFIKTTLITGPRPFTELAIRITDEGRAAFEEAFAAWGLTDADAAAPAK